VIAASSPPEVKADLRIGDIAALVGVSTRTLRYYEERGIFTPAGYTTGGERRYGPDDVAQLRRILELRDGLGLTLDEVRIFIESERRLAEIRTAYRGAEAERQPAVRERLLQEGIDIRSVLVDRITTKMGQLQTLRDDLEAQIGRAQSLLDERRGKAGG
jgi:DNA-binding transcriptional MerR regulator